jgi:hypothetical protein
LALALNNIKHEVDSMLADVNWRVASAERRLAVGGEAEKTAAARELAVLRPQQQALVKRAREVNAAPADANEGILEWAREEWFNLMLQWNAWMAGH